MKRGKRFLPVGSISRGKPYFHALHVRLPHVHGGAATRASWWSLHHDNPLRWRRLCAGLSTAVRTSLEITKKQIAIKFFLYFFIYFKMQANIQQKFIYVVSGANEVFMFIHA